MLKVVLLSHTQNPEQLIAAAAKNCYSDRSVENIMDRYEDGEKAAGFVKMLSEIGHESPIEHISFTFGLEGVSRSLLAQITRHRIASFSVRSQRYVSHSKAEYVIPPAIRDNPEALEIFTQAMEKDKEAYLKIHEILKAEHKREFLASGISDAEAEKRADKLSNEDARYVLSNACATQIVLTMNARALKHFFRLRCCRRAQWEIRQAADLMLALAYKAAPTVFKDAGPSCVSGGCPEGKMSCGETEAVRQRYIDIKKGG